MNTLSKHPFFGLRNLVLIALTVLAVPAQSAPNIYPLDSVVFGRTYSEWSAAWEQWSMSMSPTKHPLFDTANCSEGQSGSVWFLGGRFCVVDVNPSDPQCINTSAARSCTVPAGKALYFPILNISCLGVEAQNDHCHDIANVNALPFPAPIRAMLAGHIGKTTGLELTVDGVPFIGNLKKNFRVQSPVYTVVTPASNLLNTLGESEVVGGPDKEYWGMDDGVYVMLKPLAKGDHTINFKGTFPQFPFTLDFTYNITQK